MNEPIILPESCAGLEEQARLARTYRPFFRQVALGAKRFSPAARRVAAESFIRHIGQTIRDPAAREFILNTARAEFARHIGAH